MHIPQHTKKWIMDIFLLYYIGIWIKVIAHFLIIQKVNLWYFTIIIYYTTTLHQKWIVGNLYVAHHTPKVKSWIFCYTFQPINSHMIVVITNLLMATNHMLKYIILKEESEIPKNETIWNIICVAFCIDSRFWFHLHNKDSLY